ncbi:MAG: hypothetical protein R3B72_35385 [Polyangiaceae bacterium]
MTRRLQLLILTTPVALTVCGGRSQLHPGPLGEGGASSVTSGSTSTGATTGSGGAATGVGGAIGGGGQGAEGGMGQGGDCVPSPVETSAVLRPLDVVMAIDQSGSMEEELPAFEAAINPAFAAPLDAAGVDFQLILLARHGPDPLDVCVAPPLSNGVSCAGPVGDVPGRFHQDYGGSDGIAMVCSILESFDGPNGGWQKWLRLEAIKAIVPFTDERSVCFYDGQDFDDQNDLSGSVNGVAAAVGQAIDAAFVALDPLQLGTEAKRRHRLYPILGLGGGGVHGPSDAIVTTICPSVSFTPFAGMQWASRRTGGTRISMCDAADDMASVLSSLVAALVEDSADPCVRRIEEPLPVEPTAWLTPAGSSENAPLAQLSAASDCGNASGWYLEGDLAWLCPTSCAEASAPGASWELLTGCDRSP